MRRRGVGEFDVLADVLGGQDDRVVSTDSCDGH